MTSSVHEVRRFRCQPCASSKKIPLLAVGDGSFGMNMRGNVPGMVRRLRKTSKQAENRGLLVMVGINEAYTSKVCSKCHKKNMVNKNIDNDTRLYSILFCSDCKTVWNRDVNAANNIYPLALRLSKHLDRPSNLLPTNDSNHIIIIIIIISNCNERLDKTCPKIEKARRKEKVRTLSILSILAFTTLAFLHIVFSGLGLSLDNGHSNNNFITNTSNLDIPDNDISSIKNNDSSYLYTESSIRHPNTNLHAAFITFTKSDSDSLTKLRGTIRDIQDRFNGDRQYPYIIFSNEELSDEFKDLTRTLANNNIIFEHLNSTFYGYPDFIDMARADKAREDMKDIIFGASDDYRFQARFMAGMMYRHPVMADLDYYWRFEIGTQYLTPITFDPFEYMKENGKKVSFSFALYEYHDTIPSLYSAVERYVNDHPGQIFHKTEQDTLWSFILDGESETYNDCHFWSNFQIGDLNFFRGAEYQDFFNHIDHTGGIFYERWGDPVILTMAATMYLKKSQVHHWDSIGYQVGQFMHCPEDENIWKSGVCRPVSNFDYQDFSCLPLFLQ